MLWLHGNCESDECRWFQPQAADRFYCQRHRGSWRYSIAAAFQQCVSFHNAAQQNFPRLHSGWMTLVWWLNASHHRSRDYTDNLSCQCMNLLFFGTAIMIVIFLTPSLIFFHESTRCKLGNAGSLDINSYLLLLSRVKQLINLQTKKAERFYTFCFKYLSVFFSLYLYIFLFLISFPVSW